MTMSTRPNMAQQRIDNYVTQKLQREETPSEAYIEMFKTWEQQKLEQEQDPEWQKNNMEYDLRTTDWILEKVRNSWPYAQNLYAAMCNTDFQKRDVMPILQDQTWSCSWRSAGGIIADMRQQGDYIDWYCSGIREPDMPDIGFVAESVVTEEIEQDLLKLGWNVIQSGETDI